ncbi:hypothetical protein V8F20_010584 [Naviculisporaceae sp. PSN 640]
MALHFGDEIDLAECGIKALRFFPAGERRLFMVLEYLAAKLWESQEALERLELGNRKSRLTDYKEHRPDNHYGKQKELLMEKQIKLVKTYYEIFSNASPLVGLPEGERTAERGQRKKMKETSR